jgi:hypothetical protein
MTSLLHRHDPAITDEQAVSYVHGTGPWSRFLLTPWPVQSLVEGAVVLGVGAWAGIALALSNPWAGLGVCALAVLVALLVAAPGAYTETHREFASHYFAALRVHGDAQVRAHPYLVLVLAPVVGALVGAFGGVHGASESTTARVVGAAAGAVFGLVYALVRVRRARHNPLH